MNHSRNVLRVVFALVILFASPLLHASNWLWDEQIKPTAREAISKENLWILFATSAATTFARQYDFDVRVDSGDHRRMSAETSRVGDVLGSGYPGAAIAISMLIWDKPNGQTLSRSLLFTAATHRTIATLVNRERPNNGPYSFPSGHTSTAFALAGSLAYAYGPWIGVPSVALATFVGASRIADNAHWLSDTVAAAGLGLFWARASYRASLSEKTSSIAFTPFAIPGGLIISLNSEF